MRKVIIIAAIVGVVIAIAPFAGMALQVRRHEQAIAQKIHAMEAPATSAAASKAMALYCQMGLKHLPTSWFPAWMDPAITQFEPSSCTVYRDQAWVEMGAGFHHFGYRIERDNKASTDQQNVWTLFVYDEMNPDKTLCTITTDPQERVTWEKIRADADAAYAARIAQDGSGDWEKQRTRFLIALKQEMQSAATRAATQSTTAGHPAESQ